MADTEIQELHDEIERLKSHNTKLLQEKKDALAESERHSKRADDAGAELERITQRPVMNVFNDLAPNENLAGYLRQEFGRYFTVENHDGELMLKDTEGQPVTLGNEPCRFDVNTVHRLVTDRGLDSLKPLMSAAHNSGGGAPGSGNTSNRQHQQKPDESSPFGLR